MDTLDCLLPDPSHLRLDHLAVSDDGASLLFDVTATQIASSCPLCTRPATRIHSRYERRVADLPWAGLPVRIQLRVRRFFCDASSCIRRIFTERLPDALAPWARRTHRLATAQQQIGLAVGGKGGARLASTLAMAAGVDLLLQLVRQAPQLDSPEPRLIGLDDWAWRKGQRYGTIVVDLERGRPIDLLPDRLAATVTEWLRDHPGIEIITRDRSGAYAEAADAGAPDALQVADRFHLITNLRDVLLRSLQYYRTEIEQILASEQAGAKQIGSAPQSSAPDLSCVVQSDTPLPPQPTPPRVIHQQQLVHQRRQERYQTIQQLIEQGWSQEAIADKLGIARQTVHRYLKMPQGPLPQRQIKRPSILAPYKPYLLERWNTGCYNSLQLFRELQAQGFRGTDGTVRRYITQLRKAAGLPPFSRNGAAHPLASDPAPRMPSLTALCWQILRKEETRTADEQKIVGQLLTGSAPLAEVIGLAEEFAELVRHRKGEQFDTWVERASQCETSMMRAFAHSLQEDDAVRAAFSVPYSNGPVEGHINRLKCLKRQMYGRAKIDLLRQRLLAS